MPARAAVRPKAKRVRRDPERAREHILEAAIRVFSRQGADAVGLKDVAKEAGVSHALVTHYFRTYDALVDEAVARAVARLREKLVQTASSLPDPSPEAMLAAYLDTALEPWYGRLVSWALFSNHAAAARFARRFAPDMKLVADAVQSVISARMTPPPSRAQVEAMIVAVWSTAVGYAAGSAFFWRSLGRKPGPERDADLREALAAFTRSMFAGRGG